MTPHQDAVSTPPLNMQLKKKKKKLRNESRRAYVPENYTSSLGSDSPRPLGPRPHDAGSLRLALLLSRDLGITRVLKTPDTLLFLRRYSFRFPVPRAPGPALSWEKVLDVRIVPRMKTFMMV